VKAPLALTLSLFSLLFGSAAADLADQLTGGWRTETVLNNGNLQVRQITRILRLPNGRYAGIINHQPPPGQKQPPELPLNVIYYGTWTVTGDQLETAIEWASDKRFAQSSPPLKIVSVDAGQSVFASGPNTLVRQRHPWSLEAEMARTAELAGFAKDQGQFYKQQADYKPVLGQDRKTGTIYLDGDEMPSPGAVKGLSRNQNREAAAQQKLRWLQQAKAYVEAGEAPVPARPAITETKPPARPDRAAAAARLFAPAAPAAPAEPEPVATPSPTPTPPAAERKRSPSPVMAAPAKGLPAANSATLTGQARREWTALSLVIEDANAAKESDERLPFLREYLQKSEAFVKAYPDFLPAWTFRAVAALELKDFSVGNTAGKQMERLGAADSDDEQTRRVLAMLDRKGWTKDLVNLAAPGFQVIPSRTNSLGMRFVAVPGTEVLFSIWETRRQDYEAYANAAGGVDGEWRSAGFTQSANHPVVKVSWEDAQKFAAWLTEKERREGQLTAQQSYRLPTDVEWSRAVGLASETGATPKARDGGVKDVFPWGTEWPPPFGSGNYDASLETDPVEKTGAVGSFSPNDFGIFDLGGNVWEWCEDYYDGSSGARVLRGASFDDRDRDSLLSSYRRDIPADIRIDILGFRLVLVGAGVR
jgi:hypothetical protein